MAVKAVQYIRISTKEQSNWSIDGQRQINTEFASRYSLDLAKEFVDDGRSGKDFERDSWQELERYIKACHKVDPVQVIIVTRFNRFARNAAEGLAMMEDLDENYGCRIMSALENVQVSVHSPFYFKVMADLLVNADFERRVIRDQCKQGIWRATSSGRYINRAPWGYKNAKDDRRQPIIVIDPAKAEVVRTAFLDYASGLSLTETASRARAKGWKVKGKSAIRKLLTNETYAGLVRVPAYHEREATITKGIHEPIIDMATWKACQRRFSTPVHNTRRIDHPMFPLRGMLRCGYCGNPFTGNLSKGKNKHYAYYRCQTCTNVNLQAGKSHTLLAGILDQLSLKPMVIEQIKSKAEQIVKDRLSGSQEREKELKAAQVEQRKMLERAEEQFLKGTLTEATYQKWTKRIRETIVEMSMESEMIQSNLANAWIRFADAVPKLTKLGDLFTSAGSTQKKQLVGAVFAGELYLDHWGYRTPMVAPVLAHNANQINKLEVGLASRNDKHFEDSPLRGQ